jgi:hypothetical protein
MLEPGALQVCVSKFHDSKEFTLYDVDILHKPSGKKWTLKKRYSDFLTLYHELPNDLDLGDAFSFPKKSIFHTHSEMTLRRRLDAFDFLLRNVILHEPFPVVVDEFLEIAENLGLVQYKVRRKKSSIVEKAAILAVSSYEDERFSIRKVRAGFSQIVLSTVWITILLYIVAGVLNIIDWSHMDIMARITSVLCVASCIIFLRAVLLKSEWELYSKYVSLKDE